MPIRNRTQSHEPSPYFLEATKEKPQKTKTSETFVEAQPLSLGSASKPVDWKKAQQAQKVPAATPPSAHGKKHHRPPPPVPVVDATDTFLGVFLPRPSVALTRSSYSDLRPTDVRATQDFRRPVPPGSSEKRRKSSSRADQVYADGLAPDFDPIEVVSVELLFSEASEQQQQDRGRDRESRLPPSGATTPRQRGSRSPQRAESVFSASIAPSEVTSIDGQSFVPTTPKRRKSFFSSGKSEAPSSPTSITTTGTARRRSIFGGKSKKAPPPPLPIPASPLSARTRDTSFDSELLPPRPAFIKESSRSRSSLSGSSRRGSFTESVPDRPARPSTSGSRSNFLSPNRPSTSTDRERRVSKSSSRSVPASPRSEHSRVPERKMTTILSRFSSRQMGDHQCKRGYPIAVFCGAQAMDVGIITNPHVDGAYSLFFGPGHPQNTQQPMTESEVKPSHLQNPKPPTVAATARRAELIATTRALQAIHDLYQGKACAHVCMDSAYVAKAWGSWIPKWEEDGWPGDEHIKRPKDGYAGSIAASDAKKRTSKRLADEDLLRELAAIRRLYARAERRGTGAAHLYLIERNSNPASRSARQVLENKRIMSMASPPTSPVDRSPRASMTSRRSTNVRRSMEQTPARSERHRRQRSMTSTTNGSVRHKGKRETVALVPEERKTSARASRVRASSMLKAKPASPVREVDETSEVAPRGMVAASSDIEDEAEPEVLVQRRPSVKSAASAVTALDEGDGAVAEQPTTVLLAPAAVAAEEEEETPEEPVLKKQESGIFAAASASAAALYAGVMGSGFRSRPSPPADKIELPEEEEPGRTSVAAESEPKDEEDDATPEVNGKEEHDLEYEAVTDSEGESDVAPEPVVVAPPTPKLKASQTKTKANKSRNSARPAPIVVAAPVEVESDQEAASDVEAEAEATPVKKPAPRSPAKRATAEKGMVVISGSKVTPSSLEASPRKAAPVEKTAPAPTSKLLPTSASRLINYSKRKSAVNRAAPASKTTEGASLVAAPALTVPAYTGRKSVSDVTGPTEFLDVETASAISEEPEEAPASRPRAVRRQSSMPAVGKPKADDAASLKSNKSKTGRFRTISALGGRKNLGLAPEEEEWAIKAERKSKRRSIFGKREKPPPLPTSPLYEQPQNGARHRAMAVRTPSDDDENDTANDEFVAPTPKTKRSSTFRLGRHRGQSQPSLFEGYDDNKSIKSKKEKKAKAPKEPFNFKKSLGHLITME